MLHPCDHLSGLPWTHPNSGNVFPVLWTRAGCSSAGRNMKMGKGLCPLSCHGLWCHFFTARVDGPVDVLDLLGFLVFTAKRRGGVPSVAVLGPSWDKAQLPLSSCAPQPQKKRLFPSPSHRDSGSWCSPSAHFTAGHQESPNVGFGWIGQSA